MNNNTLRVPHSSGNINSTPILGTSPYLRRAGKEEIDSTCARKTKQ